MKNIWIFGDVHGEIDKFKKCIESVDLKEGDRIISLGDLVDRGKYSFEVIEYCIELQNITIEFLIQINRNKKMVNFVFE